MIKVKNTPAGWIAQFFSDTPDPKLLKEQDYVYHRFFDVTGKWMESRDSAIESVKKERVKKLRTMEKRRDDYVAKISKEIEDLRACTEVVIDDGENGVNQP